MKIITRTNIKKAIMAFLLLIAFSCTNKTSEKHDEKMEDQIVSVDDSVDCLIGKWTYNDNGNILTYVFDEDNFGYENIGSDDRHFSYTLKDGNPVIVYAGETNEWQLDLNCTSTMLTVFGLQYKKN